MQHAILSEVNVDHLKIEFSFNYNEYDSFIFYPFCSKIFLLFLFLLFPH